MGLMGVVRAWCVWGWEWEELRVHGAVDGFEIFSIFFFFFFFCGGGELIFFDFPIFDFFLVGLCFFSFFVV